MIPKGPKPLPEYQPVDVSKVPDDQLRYVPQRDIISWSLREYYASFKEDK